MQFVWLMYPPRNLFFKAMDCRSDKELQTIDSGSQLNYELGID